MKKFTVGQKIIVISIALGGRLSYQFHDYIGPHSPNHHAGKPWLAELECVDEERGKFMITRWFDPDQTQIYNHFEHGTSVSNSTAEITVECLNSDNPFEMCYFRGSSVEHQFLRKYWLDAKQYVQHLAGCVDQAVVHGSPELYSIESFFRRIREMVLLFENNEPVTAELLLPARFSIPRSRYEEFSAGFNEQQYGKQRWGQAFYGFMQAHKCQQDRWWWDRLYNADETFARSMVKALMDHDS